MSLKTEIDNDGGFITAPEEVLWKVLPRYSPIEKWWRINLLKLRSAIAGILPNNRSCSLTDRYLFAQVYASKKEAYLAWARRIELGAMDSLTIVNEPHGLRIAQETTQNDILHLQLTSGQDTASQGT
ncbi:hypothetical protein M1563_01730 [Patescibacteria group bacterium]|nr:hypothetical protein [Patescibacteria group bacterium]